MKFDAIIIGGGLAGLTCGIKLCQEGKKCLIISSGQSALHFSSGSFDLLNVQGDKLVENPTSAIDRLLEDNPTHPYSKIGKDKFIKYAQEAKLLLTDASVAVVGTADRNHYRITPMGTLKPTWMSVKDFATSNSADSLPWKKVSIFNITGFLDFHPNFVADEFRKMGVESETYFIDMPELDTLRRNPSELRATNISRLFDNEASLMHLSDVIKKGSKDCDAVIFPACIGLSANTIDKLSSVVGKPIHLIPTFPPSIVGIRTQQTLKHHFEKLGGVYMLGDSVTGVEIEGDNATKVFTYNHGDIPFVGSNIVLSTGSFFSQGLVASRDRIFEPILDLDVDYKENRQNWYTRNFFEPQNYQTFGVRTNNSFKVQKSGRSINNMYAIGAVLSGFNAMKEGCGSGVSILTALYVADEILKD